jgi:hypothetical protein
MCAQNYDPVHRVIRDKIRRVIFSVLEAFISDILVLPDNKEKLDEDTLAQEFSLLPVSKKIIFMKNLLITLGQLELNLPIK